MPKKKRTRKTTDNLLLLGYQKSILRDGDKIKHPSSEGRETADYLFSWNCGKKNNTEAQCKAKLKKLIKRAKSEKNLSLVKKHGLEGYYGELIRELEDYHKKAKVYMR